MGGKAGGEGGGLPEIWATPSLQMLFLADSKLTGMQDVEMGGKGVQSSRPAPPGLKPAAGGMGVGKG